jgi:DNA-binding response OmpR family regulator
MTDVSPVEPTPIAIDRASGALRLADRTITLTGTELRLLSLLIERLGDAVSHQEIRDYVWGYALPSTAYGRSLRAISVDRRSW